MREKRMTDMLEIVYNGVNTVKTMKKFIKTMFWNNVNQ